MSDTPETVLIVGAGIVGSALAHFLSSSPVKRKITIVDRSISPLLGSTGHAPGFIGQFNESEVLTRLAVKTVSEYSKIPHGFDAVGGLEVAFEASGIDRLKSRRENAAKMGLQAEMISIHQAKKLAPQLVDGSRPGEVLHFATDGTANAGTITSFYLQEAKEAGVECVLGDVTRLLVSNGRVNGVEIRDGVSNFKLEADKVVLATGIWAQDLCRDLGFPIPVVPVGHPYTHGRTREPNSSKLPFVRWPEHHVYARDHGDRYGMGTYDHRPVHYKPTAGTAIGEWIPDFDEPLKLAKRFLPQASRDEFENATRFNGIFSMTPDNMPLTGQVQSVPGLYMVVAVWVTHGAGTAKFLTELMDGLQVDQKTQTALDPERFRGQDLSSLEKQSLDGYNEIYKTAEAL
ncbi:hypothetical protein AK830_g8232 [Neonectria ditissima]|uniref:FAD dependent oxidoreductase domain-containing protein n=1 Tax=Neonectria ditissima TaxID=78410 RepID=A0A0P7BD02_9HYPO|nr:hypothetical protein AK830_g8232 [Neonectria ditissima]